MGQTPNAVDYAITNAAWSAVESLPPIEGIEALRVARYLLRRFAGWPRKGRPFSARVVSGNRHTWMRNGVLNVNPTKGWKDLVHGLSHVAWYLQEPTARPHSGIHAELERRMIEHVIAEGWLDGRLRPPPEVAPTKEEKRKAKLEHVRSMLHRAVTRLRRARTIEKKWRLKLRAIERDWLPRGMTVGAHEAEQTEERRTEP